MTHLRSWIILVGPRGAGKTSVGRQLASEFGVPFIDLDQEIERRSAKSIAQLFADQGEPRFREWEAEVLRELAEGALRLTAAGVLATGGGVVITPENRTLLARLGLVIWLHAPVVDLVRRLQTDCPRPPLTSLPLADEVAAVVRERAPWYQAVAGARIDAGGDVGDVAHAVRRIAFEKGIASEHEKS